MESIDPSDRPRHGCMECKAQRSYTIEPFPNGNTGWRCTVCGKILRLIPTKYSEPDQMEAAERPA